MSNLEYAVLRVDAKAAGDPVNAKLLDILLRNNAATGDFVYEQLVASGFDPK